jgi:uncharacterized protein (TIGR02284 family)
MLDKTEVVEILNDLIQINNDRIEGYKRAYNETDESDYDLRTLYSNLSEHSQQHVSELSTEISALGGEPTSGTTNSGKIYRAWMDVKAAFSSDDRKTSLENSEFGEDVAQKAYETALKSDELSPELIALITKQKATLKSGHDTIKRLRDSEKAAH